MTSEKDTLRVIAERIRSSIHDLINTMEGNLVGLSQTQVAFGTTEITLPWVTARQWGISRLENLWSRLRHDAPKAYWCSPDDVSPVLVAGTLVSVASSQSHALTAVREQIRNFEDRIHVVVAKGTSSFHCDRQRDKSEGEQEAQGNSSVRVGRTPDLKSLVQWYGGMAFQAEERDEIWADWPAAWFFLPQYEITQSDIGLHFKINICVDKTTNLELVPEELARQFRDLFQNAREETQTETQGKAVSREHYVQAVQETIEDIRSGAYEKLVLAQRQKVSSDEPYRVDKVLEELREHYSTSFVFALSRGNSCFIGASPERLVATQNRSVSIDTLAGTTRRGKTVHEDEQFGQELLLSHKNRHEHQVVLQGILDVIAPSAEDVLYTDTPTLKKLANVQHLHTPVRATLRNGAHLFDLVDALHPTPAVAGMPKLAVLPRIRSREGMDRGWYAGAVGRVSMAFDGEFCVAIRSGLIQGRVAWLYAGAGIMEDSDPSSEWEETLLKLRPMQNAVQRSSEHFGR